MSDSCFCPIRYDYATFAQKPLVDHYPDDRAENSFVDLISLETGPYRAGLGPIAEFAYLFNYLEKQAYLNTI